MSEKRFSKNEFERETSDGCLVAYSYTTAVAVRTANGEHWQTAQYYSVTTQRHLSHIASRWGFPSWRTVPQADIDRIARNY